MVNAGTKRNRPSASALDGAEDVAELMLDLVLFRETTGRFLREELAVTHGDLKDAAGAGNDQDAPWKLLKIIVQDVLRQTGGPGQIASGGAVLDPDHVARAGLSHRLLPSSPGPPVAAGTVSSASVVSLARLMPP